MDLDKPLRFLIVENDPSDVLLMKAHLKKIFRDDFKDLVVPKLEHAKALLQTKPFDLILLDLGLDDSHGLNTLNEIVKITTVPILVITIADYTSEEIKQLGAADYLNKNNLANEISKCIKAIVFDKLNKLHSHCDSLKDINKKITKSLSSSRSE